MRASPVLLLLLAGCVATADRSPDEGVARAYPADAEQAAAAAPSFVNGARVVGLPASCVGLVDAPSANDAAAAREGFARGVEAYERRDYPTAMVAFCDAYRAMPEAQLLYNIGAACERAGLYDEAADFFDTFAGRQAVPDGDIASAARVRARRLRERGRQDE